MKTNNVKKVLSIVILCIIVAITITTVILAVIPKKLYNPITEGYSAITLYRDKESQTYYQDENSSSSVNAVFDNINTHHSNSVRDNILSTIFQGTGSFNNRVVYESTSTDCMKNVAQKEDAICLIFNYLDNEQTLTIDGEAYKHSEGKGKDKTIVYTKIFMPITNNKDFQECTVYLTGSDNKSNFQVKFLAHQSDLYEYLTNLNWDMINE